MTGQEKQLQIGIDGMHCTACAQGIERHLRRIGLKDAVVDFATSSAVFSPADTFPLPTVYSEIENLGYQVREKTNTSKIKDSFVRTIEFRFILALFFTLPLLLHMFISSPLLHSDRFQLVLALPVYILGVLHFGRSAIRSIMNGMPNMDVLIFIGSSAAFFYSLTGTVFNLGDKYLFYETAAAIITFVLLGNVLENRSIKKTTSAIEELSRMQDSLAKVVRSSNGADQIEEVSAAQLRQGVVVLVNTGDRISADGEVLWGTASVDESMISGESSPVDKGISSSVIGGSVLVSGSLKFRTTAVGQSTVLANIIRLVRDTQRNKPQIQQLGDKVSAIFVPVILVIAFSTFIVSALFSEIGITQSLLNSIAVLVIACPCAMGLATPTAVMVGIGRAVREGILIRGGDTIEKFAAIKTVAFDKTGTLTTGQFKLNSFETFGVSREEVGPIVAGLERHSSHPIARALVAAFEGTRPLDFPQVEESKGIGIKGRDATGNSYTVGSHAIASAVTDDRSHTAYLVKNDSLIAVFDLADDVKINARNVVSRLSELGLNSVLISGDTEIKCRQVAEQVGIQNIYSSMRPEQKLSVIDELQRVKPLAFVGDGINDAPALAKASIGISLSDASQVAIQSAQVVLLNGDLDHLVKAVLISRRTMRTIKQNLFWALFYNVVAIPIAAIGLLSPMVAAFTMAFSDVIVIGNSLRLRGYQPAFQPRS